MKCLVNDCDREVWARKLCSMHYQRFRRHGDTNSLVGEITSAICIVEGCSNIPKYSTNMCQTHHIRYTRYGRTHSIVNRGSGFTINEAGYIIIYVNGKQKFEHVHKAEKALGKPLPDGAEVHHMNGIKHDNDTPFNLIICPSRAYHMLLHKRARDLGYEDN